MTPQDIGRYNDSRIEFCAKSILTISNGYHSIVMTVDRINRAKLSFHFVFFMVKIEQKHFPILPHHKVQYLKKYVPKTVPSDTKKI